MSGGKRTPILFLSTDLAPLGGGEAVAAWMLQALAPIYDVTILTWQRPDFAALDRKFGTSLAGSDFPLRTPNATERWLVERIPDDSNMQRVNYLVRMAKSIRRLYAVVVACCSLECDLGAPGVQYIHYPYLGRKSKVFTVAGDAPIARRVLGFLQGRVRPWMLISGYSFERMKMNLTLTNSEWTRSEIQRVFDMPSEVVYPPVEGERYGEPWARRENAFVTVGRLHHAKRQDWIIETLAKVREVEPEIKLHICGSPVDAEYIRRLRHLAKAHGGWAIVHEDLSKTDMLTLVGRQRYGIHALVDEHFGMAPAEIARAGCIPFVHASGGQREIVDHDPRLCYATREEAVAKILAVLRDPAQQEELRTAVRKRSERFAPEIFVRQVQGLLAEFLRRKVM